MPELPEVETVKLQLQKFIIGHTIVGVNIRFPKLFTGDEKSIYGAKIKNIRRFAKVLSIDLSNNLSLVIHIKLTGQLIYRGPNLKNPPSLSKKISGLGGKHTHVIFDLDRGGKLYYNDVRRFGWIKVMKTSEVQTSGFVSKLGPEPFGSAQGKPSELTLEKFRQIISKPRTAIKAVIMDQAKMGGVGNIYANDALLLSKIHPQRPANSLTPAEQKALYDAIIKVLKKGIEAGGASELAYVHPDGSDGGYQKHFIAYGREGQPCPICNGKEPARNAAHSAAGGKIKKIRVGGRGTYYCPNCQKLHDPKNLPLKF